MPSLGAGRFHAVKVRLYDAVAGGAAGRFYLPLLLVRVTPPVTAW